MDPICFVEKNDRGAWVVWGDIGIRQYYGYSRAESVRRYKKESERGERHFSFIRSQSIPCDITEEEARDIIAR